MPSDATLWPYCDRILELVRLWIDDETRPKLISDINVTVNGIVNLSDQVVAALSVERHSVDEKLHCLLYTSPSPRD